MQRAIELVDIPGIASRASPGMLEKLIPIKNFKGESLKDCLPDWDKEGSVWKALRDPITGIIYSVIHQPSGKEKIWDCGDDREWKIEKCWSDIDAKMTNEGKGQSVWLYKWMGLEPWIPCPIVSKAAYEQLQEELEAALTLKIDETMKKTVDNAFATKKRQQEALTDLETTIFKESDSEAETLILTPGKAKKEDDGSMKSEEKDSGNSVKSEGKISGSSVKSEEEDSGDPNEKQNVDANSPSEQKKWVNTRRGLKRRITPIGDDIAAN